MVNSQISCSQYLDPTLPKAPKHSPLVPLLQICSAFVYKTPPPSPHPSLMISHSYYNMKLFNKIVIWVSSSISVWFILTTALVGGARVDSSLKYDALMAKGPVPPSAASSCTHIGGGSGGDHRPCPPSTRQDAVLMAKAPVPPSSASSSTHKGGDRHRPCSASTLH